MTNKSLKEEFSIHKVLDNIIIARAFTFYQLANIIINEIPKVIEKLDSKIQIIIVDLIQTLFSSSTISNNKRDRSGLKAFYENEKLLIEIIDNLIHLSDKHFVIVTYENIDNLIKRTISSKFNNVVEMDKLENHMKVKDHHKEADLQMKIDSLSDNLMDEISINE